MAKPSLEELVERLSNQLAELQQQVEDNHNEVIEKLNNIDVSGEGFSTYRVDE